ncbi:DUF1269 domain-containing protein [Halohasta litorea]|uniref:DUF1269 domain-containing protein n=1 Tax=Halohasta litorea TaxID=869891 RepID=A0ABD6DC67_9EURY|nr:DUF1269 domain-containing protein [Halohasta litorea]
MKKLIVLAFDNENDALEVRDKLFELQKQGLIQMEDAAVVVRNEQGKTDVKQAQSLVGAGALGGKFADIGIDDDFIKEVGEEIDPGESALFMLATDAQTERVIEELEPYDPRLLETNLSTEDEEKLREEFAADGLRA